MKIIALPDLHSARGGLLDQIADSLAAADVILLPGDVTNGRVSELYPILETLRRYTARVLAIPGNWDGGRVMQVMTEEGINLHRRHEIIDGVAFVGVGGALPYIGTYEIDEADFERFLDEAWRGLPNGTPTVLVCHHPPYGTAADFVGEGSHLDTGDRFDKGRHIGCQAVRAAIERRQPLLCFTGHVHEAKSIDTIAGTRVINPGPLWQGGYALAEINGGALTRLEIRRVAVDSGANR
jgi:hypothetical protein